MTTEIQLNCPLSSVTNSIVKHDPAAVGAADRIPAPRTAESGTGIRSFTRFAMPYFLDTSHVSHFSLLFPGFLIERFQN